MSYIKSNRTSRFEHRPTDRLLEETDVEENTPGIENHPNTGEHFSSVQLFQEHNSGIQYKMGGFRTTNESAALQQTELMGEIMAVTTTIRETFAELYELLSETPLFIAKQNQKICTADFEQYLESLKTQLAAFEK